jgi:O-antigen ligase
LIEVGSARTGHRDGGTATAAVALLAAALGGGLLAQGGFYPRAQWFIGLLLCAALLLQGRQRAADMPAALVLAGSALGGWALVDGALHHATAGGLRYALLIAGVLAAVLGCQRLAGPARESLLAALLTVGAVVAGLGWLGVLLHRNAWAWRGDGLWRASSSLSYPNAAAAVLAILALLCLALLSEQPRSVPLGLAATGLLAGLGATLSRAGLLGLLAGGAVLAAVLGARALLRVGWSPVLGGVLVLAGLVPSMPASSSPHPTAAVVGLAAGLVAGAGLPALGPSRRASAGTAAILALALPFAVSATARRGFRMAADTRATLDSPDRLDSLRAAWRVFWQHPATGAGPGLARLTWTRPGGGVGVFRYAHNEYLQVLAELGVVGLVLLVGLLVALVRVPYRARAGCGALRAAALAGCAALAVHAGLDFVWHLPAIPLLAAALVGLATPEWPAQPSGP